MKATLITRLTPSSILAVLPRASKHVCKVTPGQEVVRGTLSAPDQSHMNHDSIEIAVVTESSHSDLVVG